VRSFRSLGLGHPNIVHYYSDFIKDDVGVIVFEKLAPLTLEQHIESNGRLDLADALGIFQQIVAAVAYMHEKHVSPRDLKTENIAYDSATNTVKLFDLGFALRLQQNEDGTYPKVAISNGSPVFMAPEVLAMQPHDSFAHDIWCLGHVLYFLLVGRDPFPWCKNLADLCKELLILKRLPFPTWLPARIIFFLQSMLHFDPAKRLGIEKVRETVLELLAHERDVENQ
jgi:serine/threonine protein kinase